MRKSLIVLFCTIAMGLFIFSPIFGRSNIAYSLTQGEEITYNITYATTPQNDTNSTGEYYMKIITSTLTDPTPNSSVGVIIVLMEYSNDSSPGWQTVQSGWTFNLNYNEVTNIPQALDSNVTLTDGSITYATICQFFESSIFLIPTGTNSADENSIGNFIDLQLLNAYGGNPLENARNGLTYSFSRLGAANYSLTIQYDQTDGILDLFKLTTPMNATHVVFMLQRQIAASTPTGGQTSTIAGYDPLLLATAITSTIGAYIAIKITKKVKYH